MPRLLFLGLLALLAGCATSASPPLPTDVQVPPPEARTSAHYRDFDSADALAAYLRADSEAGPLVSAHRGGPAPGFPENALATFERALGYGPVLIECDVRMSRDSVLVLLHDATLERTTTGEGAVAERPFTALRRLLLEDVRGLVTPFRIPSLREALAWAEGRAVLMLDVKSDVPPRLVAEAIERADAADQAVVIAYTFDDLLTYRRLLPDVVLSASASTAADVRRLLESRLDPSRLVAFVGVGAEALDPAAVNALRERGIRVTLGTFGEIDERARRVGPEAYGPLLEGGVGILATDVVPVAAEAVYEEGRKVGG